MHLNYTPESEVTDQLVGFYEERARGGAGLIVIGGCRINELSGAHGGDLSGRMRFPLEVAEAVRSAVGNDFAVQMRLGGNDYMPGGNTLDDTLVFARKLEEIGTDSFSITGVWHETRIPQLPMEAPKGCYVYLARGVKEIANKPVVACNRINDPFLDVIPCYPSGSKRRCSNQ